MSAEKGAANRVQGKQTPEHNATKQTNKWPKAEAEVRRPTKGSLSNNNNNVEDTLYSTHGHDSSKNLDSIIQLVYHCHRHSKTEYEDSVKVRKRSYKNWPSQFTFPARISRMYSRFMLSFCNER